MKGLHELAFGGWSDADRKAAAAEGWALHWVTAAGTGCSGSSITPTRHDPTVLQSDERMQWVRHVEIMAAGGSLLHQRAIAMERLWDHGQGHNYWEADDYPDFLKFQREQEIVSSPDKTKD